MNTGIERRPFRLLRPVEHSAAMVIARYANRRGVKADMPAGPNDLLWRALRMGSVCAACAFAFFVLSERHLIERTGETLGALPDSIQRVHLGGSVSAATRATPRPSGVLEDAKTASAALQPRKFQLPAESDLKVTEFALVVSPEFQNLGAIQLRLAAVNTTAGTYDITVKTREREFYRQDVKLEEHVPLSKSANPGPEIVVGEIAQNRVFGYLSEPQTKRHRRK